MDVQATFLPVITELLTEFGTTATLSRKSMTGGSRIKAGGKTVTMQSIPTLAVIGPETITDEQGRQVTVTMATMLAQPRENDRLILGAQTYVIGNVTCVAPQGAAVVWKAVVTQ